MNTNQIRHQFTDKPSSTRLRGELADSRARHDEMLDTFDNTVTTPEIPGSARRSTLIKKAAAITVAATLGIALIHEAAGAADSAQDHAPRPPAPLIEHGNR